MLRAQSQVPVVYRATAQPTMKRNNRSRIAARYSLPLSPLLELRAMLVILGLVHSRPIVAHARYMYPGRTAP